MDQTTTSPCDATWTGRHVEGCGHAETPSPLEQRWQADYAAGKAAGTWAAENIPAVVKGRDGLPSSTDIVTHDPDWTTGYEAGATMGIDPNPFDGMGPVRLAEAIRVTLANLEVERGGMRYAVNADDRRLRMDSIDYWKATLVQQQDAQRNAERRLVEATIALIIAQVNEGWRMGWLPRSVASFSELHDFCDANTLGGMCDDDGPWAQFTSDDEDEADHLRDWSTTLRNEVTDKVDIWIKNGR